MTFFSFYFNFFLRTPCATNQCFFFTIIIYATETFLNIHNDVQIDDSLSLSIYIYFYLFIYLYNISIKPNNLDIKEREVVGE